MGAWLRLTWCAWTLTVACSLLPRAASAETFFTANLSGAEEVPANASSATGFGRITLNDSETQITVSVYYQGLGSNVIMGHVHGSAAPGGNAPIMFDLAPTTGVTSGSVVGRTFSVTPSQVTDLKAGLLYFNIHTVNFSNGEIRGQLRVDAPFTATLAGGQQVPSIEVAGTGRGWVSLNAAGTQALATLRWSGLTGPAIMAHIHAERSGVNGGVICDFSPPATASGEVVDFLCTFTPTQTAALRAKGLYFNIHTGAHGGGEIRGQIKRTNNPCDFDADGKSDYAIVRNSGSSLEWWVNGSATGSTLFYRWGAPTDFGGTGRILCADVDGDGKADPTIWRSGASAQFWSLLSTGGVRSQVWGTTGDDPVLVGDYDGDGRDDYAIVRESGGSPTTWFILESSTGATRVEYWGVSTDFPIPGPDYDGDARADLGVQRGGVIFRKLSSTGSFDAQNWGMENDLVHSSDHDGDGRTDSWISRIVGGHYQWWVLGSLTNTAATPYGAGFFFGTETSPAAIRTVADFDGDGRTDVAVWKAEASGAGTWWVQRANGTLTTFIWGVAGDVPAHLFTWK
jgi:CHRD domain